MTFTLLYAILTNMDIKKIRKDLGLTQEDFARKVGVSWSTVARWEAGKGHPSRLAQRNIEKLIK